MPINGINALNPFRQISPQQRSSEASGSVASNTFSLPPAEGAGSVASAGNGFSANA